MPEFLTTPEGRRIAYHRTTGAGPGIVFCGGFRSDMQGSKAQYLEAWAKSQGRAFVRFDYSGHGESGGDFLDGAIGDWLRCPRGACRADRRPADPGGLLYGGLDFAAACARAA